MPVEGMITVRYFAGARAAAGTGTEQVATATLTELTALLERLHGPQLARVLAASTFLVDGVAWHEPHAQLPAGATVDVLPPFAGG